MSANLYNGKRAIALAVPREAYFGAFTGITLLIFLALGVAAMSANAYEKTFEATSSGEMEIKTIPATKVLVAEGTGDYFDNSNRLFGSLFRYIKKNEVAMTTPVEAVRSPATMKFYVGTKDAGKALADTSSVKVVDSPARKVASIGARGSYSKGNFEKAERKLRAWLEKQDGYRPNGAAYGVYWNGPFVPPMLKRFEVHIPVAAIEDENT